MHALNKLAQERQQRAKDIEDIEAFRQLARDIGNKLTERSREDTRAFAAL